MEDANKAILGALGTAIFCLLGAVLPATGRARGETTDVRRRLQKRASAEGNSGEPVHGVDGILLRLPGPELRILPLLGQGHLGRLAPPTTLQAARRARRCQLTMMGHQQGQLRGTAGGDLLLLPQRRRSSQDNAGTGRRVRRRCRRTIPTRRRLVPPLHHRRSGSREVHRGAWRDAAAGQPDQLCRQGNQRRVWRRGL